MQTVKKAVIPRRRPGHPGPARHQGHAQGDAAHCGQARHPVPVEEAVRSGITDILIILSRNQTIIEDHFDRNPELEAKLSVPGKEKMLEECLGISNLAHIYFVRQHQTLGLGHAVSMAQPFTGDDPFVVITATTSSSARIRSAPS